MEALFILVVYLVAFGVFLAGQCPFNTIHKNITSVYVLNWNVLFHFTRSHALMTDDWEVDGDLVSLEEELGEGAFGKVYKGTLKETDALLRKLPVKPPTNVLRKATTNQSTRFTVAVKMLHGNLLCIGIILKITCLLASE